MAGQTPKILIADDDTDFAQLIAGRCAGLGLAAITAHDAVEALQLALNIRPDLICLDVDMPSGSGLSVAELIVGNPELAGIPVIMLTGSKSEHTVRSCHQLCAYYVLKQANFWTDLASLIGELLDLPADSPPSSSSTLDQSPVPEGLGSRRVRADEAGRHQPTEQLVDAVFQMLGADERYLDARRPREPGQQPWVLMIEDDRDFSWALKLRLESYGVAVARAFDGVDGMQSAFAYPADAILLDFELPNGRGDAVLERLKDHSITKDIPVIMLTGRKEKSIERRLLSMGAEAFLTKPLDMPRLLDELSRHIPILPRTDELAAAGALD